MGEVDLEDGHGQGGDWAELRERMDRIEVAVGRRWGGG